MIAVWVFGIAALIGAVVYFKITLGVIAQGELRVRVEKLGFADLLLASVLTAWLSIVILSSWGAEKKPGPVEPAALLVMMGIWSMIVVSILLSMRSRGIQFTEIMNLRKELVPGAMKSAVVLTACALPIVITISNIAGNAGNEQEALQVLRNTKDPGTRALLVFNAALFAPVVEEILFRGYLYAVMKRYLGVGVAILLSSVIFAALHLHGPTLAPLFVLAVCFALAYETSGTLLVPVFMHILFNSIMLAAMFSGLASPPQ